MTKRKDKFPRQAGPAPQKGEGKTRRHALMEKGMEWVFLAAACASILAVLLICVFLFGIWVAWDENSSIFRVVYYAWAGLGAAFGPLTLFSLYWRRTTKQGAIAGMLTGAITVLVWHNFIKPLGGIFGIYELLPAFVLGCLAIFIVSKLTPEPDASILEEFDHYRDDRAPKAAEQA